ncbi:MAG: ATP phosphoribosyltransferase [Thermoactinomyces sp.]
MLTIAMPKGRIMKEALALFQEAGWPIPPQMELDSRKLVVSIPAAGFTLLLAKPMDVPTYVEYGVADLGVTGKDVLMEQSRDVYELLDLGISPCRMSVAGKPDWQPTLHPRVATKYPRIAETYFKEQGEQVEIINLHGSVELAPMIGLAERIVDIVSTGRTLKENGLIEWECIAEITSRLIANKGSYRLKSKSIQKLLNQLEMVI